MQGVFRNTVLVIGGVVEGRRKEGVESDAEGVFDHAWYDAIEDGAVHFEAGIGVDFDEPGVKV